MSLSLILQTSKTANGKMLNTQINKNEKNQNLLSSISDASRGDIDKNIENLSTIAK